MSNISVSTAHVSQNWFQNVAGWITIFGPSEPIVFSGVDFAAIQKQKKVKSGSTEGYECTDCKDFYPMAELNQPDNSEEYIRFTCYGCRQGLKTIFI